MHNYDKRRSLLRHDFVVGHFAVFDEESHFKFDLLGGEEGVRHHDSPEIIGKLGFGIANEHFAFLDHELLCQDCHLAKQGIEILLFGEVLLAHLGRDDPEADIEGIHAINDQLEIMMSKRILLDIECEAVLFFDLLGDVSPAVAFEVGPQLKHIDDSSALQVLVADIKLAAI